MSYTLIPDSPIHLPCGGTAYHDPNSSAHSYRCEDCGAVPGSIGQSKECSDEVKKYENWAELGGMQWDYTTGKPNHSVGKIHYVITKSS